MRQILCPSTRPKRLGLKNRICKFCRWLPVCSFIFVFGIGLLLLSRTLVDEAEQNRRSSQEAARGIKTFLETRLQSNTDVLNRMSDRMAAGYMPSEDSWRLDASNYVKDITEFKVVEWIGSDLRIKWLEPIKGNEKAINLDLTFELKRKTAVSRAVNERKKTISKILNLVQGGQGFLIYAPAFRDGKFLGISAGVCIMNDLISEIPSEYLSKYDIKILEEGTPIFSTTSENTKASHFHAEENMSLYSSQWRIQVIPKVATIQSWASPLPSWIFGMSLVLACLTAFSVKEWVEVQRLAISRKAQSAEFEASKNLLEHIFETAPVGMVMLNLDGSWREVNQSFCDLLEYPREELLLLGFSDVTYKEDLNESQVIFEAALSGESDEYTFSKRFVTKSGNFVNANVHGRIIRDQSGKPLFLVSQIQDITEQVERENNLEKLAARDSLTGLYNRRSLDRILREAFESASSQNQSFSVIMFDLDHFKNLNDEFGHSVGDTVLQQVSILTQEQCGADEEIARYGGEEFAIVCSHHADEAYDLAERIRRSIEVYRWDNRPITASFGVAELSSQTRSGLEVLKSADKALYQAKGQGRNRVCFWEKDIDLDEAS